MTGQFVRPIKPAIFFERFLPESGPSMLSTVQVLQELEVVAAKENEIEMYEPFFFATLPLIEDSQSGVFLDRKVKPDVMFYDKDGVPSKPSAALARGCGEFKIKLEDEPFALDGKTPFETDTLHSRDTHDQITGTLYTNAIQALQYRTHSFSFFINGSSCRLVHWSRSQAVVTEPFNYTKEDWILIFFWRLGHSTKATYGVDDSFTAVTDNVMATKARQVLGLLRIRFPSPTMSPK
uniref:Fungal-type protein kinase domain-containing protein n=1 Tax=Moniliophthora roreri TaxID=221103 RepID=A0A0W0F9U8_MONRR